MQGRGKRAGPPGDVHREGVDCWDRGACQGGLKYYRTGTWDPRKREMGKSSWISQIHRMYRDKREGGKDLGKRRGGSVGIRGLGGAAVDLLVSPACRVHLPYSTAGFPSMMLRC